MNKWFKPLLAIAVFLVLAGSCFYLGERTGYKKGYKEGTAKETLAHAKHAAWMNVVLLEDIRMNRVSKEEPVENLLMVNILTISALKKYDSGDENIIMKNVADYVKTHPFKKTLGASNA